MKNISDDIDTLEGHVKKPLLKVIREKCLDCCVYKPSEVRLCACTKCPLWPYRMSTNPFHDRKMTDEDKQAATERLKDQKNEN
jgi:hypothetical protein